MNPPKKNLGESVRQRLLNGAKERGEDFNLVLTRYAIERLLYRLSQSSQPDRFILKGAALYNVWAHEVGDFFYRPTRDLDLWSSGSPSVATIVEALRAALQNPVEDDGIEFLLDSIQGKAMREDAQYEGCRVQIEARLASARITVQIDFGFGDTITPPAQTVPYPTLLEGLPVPLLRVYPRETVVAEKFEAMVSLALFNTRMKDFFDLWTLSHHFEFEGETLQQALAATFSRRQTQLPTQVPVALTQAFFQDVAKLSAWRSFGRRSQINTLADLPSVTARLTDFLFPVALAAAHTTPFRHHWHPMTGWQPIPPLL